MVITPNGQKIVLDEDELLRAFERREITQKDVDNAYQTLIFLEKRALALRMSMLPTCCYNRVCHCRINEYPFILQWHWFLLRNKEKRSVSQTVCLRFLHLRNS